MIRDQERAQTNAPIVHMINGIGDLLHTESDTGFKADDAYKNALPDPDTRIAMQFKLHLHIRVDVLAVDLPEGDPAHGELTNIAVDDLFQDFESNHARKSAISERAIEIRIHGQPVMVEEVPRHRVAVRHHRRLVSTMCRHKIR